MTFELVQQNWALISASVIGVAVLLFVIQRVYRDSSRGRLQSAVAVLKQRRHDVGRQQKKLDKAERHLEQLQARAESVKPRIVSEAGEAVTDGKSLLRIMSDQVLVAETKVRTIIVEEFPPLRHDALRQRYLDG